MSTDKINIKFIFYILIFVSVLLMIYSLYRTYVSYIYSGSQTPLVFTAGYLSVFLLCIIIIIQGVEKPCCSKQA
jgi:hypothetical protein